MLKLAERDVPGRLDMCVVAEREVAAVHVHAAQRVAVAAQAGRSSRAAAARARASGSACQVTAAASVKAPPKPSSAWKRRVVSTKSRAAVAAARLVSRSASSGACSEPGALAARRAPQTTAPKRPARALTSTQWIAVEVSAIGAARLFGLPVNS